MKKSVSGIMLALLCVTAAHIATCPQHVPYVFCQPGPSESDLRDG